jgi:hypothetical protein
MWNVRKSEDKSQNTSGGRWELLAFPHPGRRCSGVETADTARWFLVIRKRLVRFLLRAVFYLRRRRK